MHPGIQKIADLFGVRLNLQVRPDTRKAQYDGHDIACLGQNDSNILHDIAHYAICPADRRSVVDFGLGPGPDSGRSMFDKTYLKVERKFSNAEEGLASALGIAYEVVLGLNWRNTCLEHCWHYQREAIMGLDWENAVKEGDGLEETMNKLQEMGFIDHEYLPRIR